MRAASSRNLWAQLKNVRKRCYFDKLKRAAYSRPLVFCSAGDCILTPVRV